MRIILARSPHFRSHVRSATILRLRQLTLLVSFSEAPIDYLEREVGIHDDVLGLEVPVSETTLFHMLDSFE